MNQAETRAVTHLVDTLRAMGWKPVKFYDGEAYQRGADFHNMTAAEVCTAVASVDDGLIYFRRMELEGNEVKGIRYATVRTIPDHCRDGIEVINDHSIAHGFGEAMERVYETWGAEHAR